jgi:hypothetical protein
MWQQRLDLEPAFRRESRIDGSHRPFCPLLLEYRIHTVFEYHLH